MGYHLFLPAVLLLHLSVNAQLPLPASRTSTVTSTGTAAASQSPSATSAITQTPTTLSSNTSRPTSPLTGTVTPLETLTPAATSSESPCPLVNVPSLVYASLPEASRDNRTRFSVSWDGFENNRCNYAGNYFVYVYSKSGEATNITCSVVDDMALLNCSLGHTDGPGAGRNLAIAVSNAALSPPPPPGGGFIRYPFPVINNVSVLGTTLQITGRGFGRSNETLDWVRYSAQAGYVACPWTENGFCSLPCSQVCGGVCGAGSCATASRRLFHAIDCAVTESFTRIQCALDPDTWGDAFWLQVSVGEQNSTWWESNPDWRASSPLHAPPHISSLRVVPNPQANNELDPASALTSGGSLVVITGAGISPGVEGERRIDIGGVNCSEAVISRVWYPNGTSVLTLIAPPGFGEVDVTVSIGGRSSNILKLTYQRVRVSGESVKAVRISGSSANSDSAKSFLLLGEGLSACALLQPECSRLSDFAHQACPDDAAHIRSVCARPNSASSCLAEVLVDNERVEMAPFYCRNNKSNTNNACKWDNAQQMHVITSFMGKSDTGLCIRTNAVSGKLDLSIAGFSTTYQYAFDRLESPPPAIISRSPDQRDLSPSGGTSLTFSVENSGNTGGLVRLLWDSDGSTVNFTCPITSATLMPANRSECSSSSPRLAGFMPPNQLCVENPNIPGDNYLHYNSASPGCAWAWRPIVTAGGNRSPCNGLPCCILQWGNDDCDMIVSTPAWQGRVQVTFLTGNGRTPERPLPGGVRYEAPALSVAPATGRPGQTISLKGGDLGRYASLAELYASYALFPELVEQTSFPLDSLGKNTVWVGYEGTQSNRLDFDDNETACLDPVWNADGSVQCRLPSFRIPGSRHTLVLCHFGNGVEKRCSNETKAAVITYEPISLSRCNVTSAGRRLPRGGWNLSITPYTDDPSACPLYELNSQSDPDSPVVPGVTSDWTTSLLINATTALSGRVNGALSLTILRPIKSDFSELVFSMPAAIGDVRVELVYSRDGGALPSGNASLSTTLRINYEDQSLSVQANDAMDDPCLLLSRLSESYPCRSPAWLGNCSLDAQNWTALDLLSAATQCGALPLPLPSKLVRENTRDEACELNMMNSTYERHRKAGSRSYALDESRDSVKVLKAMRLSDGFCWPNYPLRRLYPLPWREGLNASTADHDLIINGAKPDANATCSDADADASPCFLARTPGGGFRKLRIEAESFGRVAGGAEMTVRVQLISMATSRAPVECTRPQIDQTDDAIITCDVEESDLPVGDFYVSVNASLPDGVATRNIAYVSSAAERSPRWKIRAVCPPQSFADNTTHANTNATSAVLCKKCPANGLCAGGEIQPRAAPTYWKTDLQEWSKLRNIDLVDRGYSPETDSTPRFSLAASEKGCKLDSNQVADADTCVDDFVPCAVPTLCLGNQLCKIGTSGFMCLDCDTSFARAFDGTCAPCTETDATEAVVILFLFLVSLAIVMRLLYTVDSVRVHLKPMVDACVNLYTSAVDSIAHLCGCGCCATRHAPSPSSSKQEPSLLFPATMTMAQALITYFQSLAAIQALIPPSRTPPVTCALEDQTCDHRYGPAFLGVIRQFNDLGLGTTQLSCLLTRWSKDAGIKNTSLAKGYFFVLLPIVVLGGGLFVFFAVMLRAHVKRARARAAAHAPSVEFSQSDGKLVSSSFSSSSLGNALGYWLAFLLVNALSPSIGAVSRLQDCAKVSTGGYLLDDPSVSCHSPYFLKLQTFARDIGAAYLVLPLALGLVCMIPALEMPRSVDASSSLLLSLHMGLSKFTQFVPLYIPSFLKEGYAQRKRGAERRWHPPLGWELITLFRKGLLMAVASGFTGLGMPLAKVVATILILFVSTLCHIVVQPFAMGLLNSMETFAFIGEMFFAAAILARAAPAAVANREKNTFDLVAIAVNALFLVFVAALLVDRRLQGRLGLAVSLERRASGRVMSLPPADASPDEPQLNSLRLRSETHQPALRLRQSLPQQAALQPFNSAAHVRTEAPARALAAPSLRVERSPTGSFSERLQSFKSLFGSSGRQVFAPVRAASGGNQQRGSDVFDDDEARADRRPIANPLQRARPAPYRSPG